MRRHFNWQLGIGFLLAIVAFVSYFAFFARYPVTRDVPWASFALFGIALALLVVGWRKAPRKIVATLVVALGIFVTGAFTFLVTLGSRDLPMASRAPAVGEMAPDFTLPDMNNRPVSLSNVLAQSNGVVLIFYRGYW